MSFGKCNTLRCSEDLPRYEYIIGGRPYAFPVIYHGSGDTLLGHYKYHSEYFMINICHTGSPVVGNRLDI